MVKNDTALLLMESFRSMKAAYFFSSINFMDIGPNVGDSFLLGQYCVHLIWKKYDWSITVDIRIGSTLFLDSSCKRAHIRIILNALQLWCQHEFILSYDLNKYQKIP